MKYLVVIAGMAICMMLPSAPAHAVACAAGVHRAGCVATPRARTVVHPHAAVVHRPVAVHRRVVR